MCINIVYLMHYHIKDVISLLSSCIDTENILYSKHGKQIVVSDTTLWYPGRSTALAMVLPSPLSY